MRSRGALLTSTGALRIGGNSIWGEYFQGRIDEVRVYNRALAVERDPDRHEHARRRITAARHHAARAVQRSADRDARRGHDPDRHQPGHQRERHVPVRDHRRRRLRLDDQHVHDHRRHRPLHDRHRPDERRQLQLLRPLPGHSDQPEPRRLHHQLLGGRGQRHDPAGAVGGTAHGGTGGGHDADRAQPDHR